MANLINQDEQNWANGVMLKRTRDGYTWTVAIAAAGNTIEQVMDAARTAEAIDAYLTSKYGRAK